MVNKYVLFIPQGGLNDCFSNISRVIDYCQKKKRILLLDMINSKYKINFNNYFIIKNCKCEIIYDVNNIKEILSNNKFTIYPDNLDFELIDLYNTEIKFNWIRGKSYFRYKDIMLELPNNTENDIILHSCCGGGNGFEFLKNISLKPDFKNLCRNTVNLMSAPYLCIQVRNTDLKCDYKQLYSNNKTLIDSYDIIYLCTDDKNVLNFFKSKHRNVYCFTTFPENESRNLHYSNVKSNIKIKDVFVDIFMFTNSEKILSVSKGGFINLLKKCFNNKKIIMDKLL